MLCGIPLLSSFVNRYFNHYARPYCKVFMLPLAGCEYYHTCLLTRGWHWLRLIVAWCGVIRLTRRTGWDALGLVGSTGRFTSSYIQTAKLLHGDTESWKKMNLSNPMHWEACTVRKITYSSVWFHTDKLYDKKRTFCFPEAVVPSLT
jgi:hypothetical protein